MESDVGTEHLAFCSEYNPPTIFRNLQKRKLTCKWSVTSLTTVHEHAYRHIPPQPSIVRAPTSVSWNHTGQLIHKLNHGNNPYLNQDHKMILKKNTKTTSSEN